VNSLRSNLLPSLLLGAYVVLAVAAYVLMARTWNTPGYIRTGMETYWFSTWPVLFLAYPAVGALIASRHPRNAIGWLFCGVGLLWGLALFATGYAAYGLKAHPAALPGAMTANWFQSWAFFPALGLIVVYVPLLFPNGKSLGGRWRFVAWSGALGIILTTAIFAFEPGQLDDGLGGFPNPYGALPDPFSVGFALIGFPLTLASAIAASTSMVLRLRRAHGVEREQLKWIAYASAILVIAFAAHLTLSFSGLAEHVWWYGVLWGMALCGVPIAAGLAMLRRGLFDIDLVINRTLVYAALTLIVAGGYVLIVVGVGALFRGEGGFLLSLVATGIVAVAFQPLRDRVQRGVNRLLYGDRDDPYAVLSRLGQRLEGTLAQEEILPAIVRTLTDALHLPYAAIVLPGGTVLDPAAAAGRPVAGVVRLPLVYQTEPVGELVVAPRAPGETFGPADRRLLEDLARQIGVAAHAVRLTADLQRSRQRLVSAREEERRRLRRDLHDGLGAQLAALAIQAGALRAAIPSDPVAATALAAELRTELRSAVADIRRLVHDLRPPALDELGLVGALRERATRYAAGGLYQTDAGEQHGDPRLAVSVLAPDDLPPLPAAVEVAVYRIVDEALANVAKHASAHNCRVHLEVTHRLTVIVEDDGVGLAPNRVVGVGLLSMRERAEELGGTVMIESRAGSTGTRLLVCLPLPILPEG
jgi:signal transduction histidine kinase